MKGHPVSIEDNSPAFVDAVMGVLTSEWMTTNEVAEAAGVSYDEAYRGCVWWMRRTDYGVNRKTERGRVYWRDADDYGDAS